MSSGRLPAHLERCSYSLVTCPNFGCSKRFPRKNEATHLAGCPHWECQNAHCPFVGPRADVDTHQPACDAVTVQLGSLREEYEAQTDELETLRAS